MGVLGSRSAEAGETRQSLTQRVATSFASVAQALRERGHDPQAVAHIVNRLVFCMFADDVGLLPDHMFTRMLRHARPAPERFTELAGDLFEVMATGGRVGFETVAWFNGGLFDDSTVLPLEKSDIETVLAASDLDWSEIDPSILSHCPLSKPLIPLTTTHTNEPLLGSGKGSGERRGATHPKTSGFRPRQVRLRRTCRGGRSPRNLPWQEGQRGSRHGRRPSPSPPPPSRLGPAQSVEGWLSATSAFRCRDPHARQA